MTPRNAVPDFFVYGEPSRSLDVGFLHVETVMERKTKHFGSVAPHQHALLGQITYWYKGEGVYRIEDRSWNFSAPAVSFVPSSVVHGFDVSQESDAIVVSISVDVLAALSAQVSLDLDAPVFRTGHADDPSWQRLDGLLGMLFEEYREQQQESGLLTRGLIGAALNYVARLSGGEAVHAASPAVALGFALRRAIDLHYKEDWSVSRYVEALATTPHLLDKAARETFGMPVKELLMERRLLEAKRLLMFTIRPVEDIGRDIGFQDPSYFSRFFRRRTGEAPAIWRRMHADRTVAEFSA